MSDELSWYIRFWIIGMIMIITSPLILLWLLVIALPIKIGQFVDGL